MTLYCGCLAMKNSLLLQKWKEQWAKADSPLITQECRRHALLLQQLAAALITENSSVAFKSKTNMRMQSVVWNNEFKATSKNLETSSKDCCHSHVFTMDIMEPEIRFYVHKMGCCVTAAVGFVLTWCSGNEGIFHSLIQTTLQDARHPAISELFGGYEKLTDAVVKLNNFSMLHDG